MRNKNIKYLKSFYLVKTLTEASIILDFALACAGTFNVLRLLYDKRESAFTRYVGFGKVTRFLILRFKKKKIFMINLIILLLMDNVKRKIKGFNEYFLFATILTIIKVFKFIDLQKAK